MRYCSYHVLLPTLFLFVLLFKGEQIVETLQKNLALHILHHTLIQDNIDAAERQQHLNRVSSLLTNSNSLLFDNLPESEMVPAILQGLAYLRRGETAVAAHWFQTAAVAPPYPEKQQAITVSPWMSIEQDGSLTVSGNSKLWRVRPDTQESGTIQVNEDGSATFNCHVNNVAERAAFEWVQPYDLTFHHTVQLEAWIAKGTTLILETHVDGNLQRLLSIPGTDQRQIVEAPVTGSSGRLIYLIVAQNSDAKENKLTCTAQIIAVRFLLD